MAIGKDGHISIKFNVAYISIFSGFLFETTCLWIHESTNEKKEANKLTLIHVYSKPIYTLVLPKIYACGAKAEPLTNFLGSGGPF